MARPEWTKQIKVDEFYPLFEKYEKLVKNNPILVHDYKWKDVESVLIKKEKPLTLEWYICFVEDEKGISVEHYFYNQDKAYWDYLGVCNRIRFKIKNDQINWGMTGIYNSSITQRLNGLLDKQESTNNNTNTNLNINASEIDDVPLDKLIREMQSITNPSKD